ncbi:hypothetical protein NFI96_024157, partial [Prochilodus magdalenae]
MSFLPSIPDVPMLWPASSKPVCKTNKCVFIDSDGHFWSHESSNTHSVDSGTLHLSHQATRTTSRLLIGF